MGGVAAVVRVADVVADVVVGPRRLDVRSMAGGAFLLAAAAAFCLASYTSLARRAIASCFAAAVRRGVRLVLSESLRLALALTIDNLVLVAGVPSVRCGFGLAVLSLLGLGDCVGLLVED